jgi:hypothetical protein
VCVCVCVCVCNAIGMLPSWVVLVIEDLD